MYKLLEVCLTCNMNLSAICGIYTHTDYTSWRAGVGKIRWRLVLHVYARSLLHLPCLQQQQLSSLASAWLTIT